MDSISASRVIARAEHVVTVWSPWWSTYLGHVDYVYSSGEVPTITGLSSLIFRVNTDFLANASIMDVAVALEFALQQAFRHMDDRVAQMALDHPEADEALIGLSSTMEIVSDLDNTFSGLTQASWSALVNRSVDNKFVSHYDVSEPPAVSGLPRAEDRGYPSGLRAENYLRMLLAEEEEREEQWLEDQSGPPTDDPEESEPEPESGEEPGAGAGSEDGSAEPESGDPSGDTSDSPSGDPSGDTSDSPSGGTSDSPSGDPSDSPSGDTSDSPSDSHHPEDHPEDHPGVGVDHDDRSAGPGQSPSDEHDPSVDPSVDPSDGPSDSQEGHGDTSGTSESEGPSEPHIDPQGDPQGDELGPDDIKQDYHSGAVKPRYISLAEEIRRTTDPGMIFPPNRGEETLVGKSDEEMEDITTELAKAVLSPPSIPGLPSASDGFTEWAKSRLTPATVSWKRILPGMLNVVMSRATMSGMTDLSYSKQNPNQKEGAPIMMGFITYPPEVTILIDASPSMRPHVDALMSEFIAVVKKIFLIYSQPVTIAVADGKVRWADQSVTPYDSSLRQASRTHHGTSYDFGKTISQIMKRGVKTSNQTFPKPDILVVFTDCEFEFPWSDKRSTPRSLGEVIVVSVSPKERVDPLLPPWIKPGRNFVATS